MLFRSSHSPSVDSAKRLKKKPRPQQPDHQLATGGGSKSPKRKLRQQQPDNPPPPNHLLPATGGIAQRSRRSCSTYSQSSDDSYSYYTVAASRTPERSRDRVDSVDSPESALGDRRSRSRARSPSMESMPEPAPDCSPDKSNKDDKAVVKRSASPPLPDSNDNIKKEKRSRSPSQRTRSRSPSPSPQRQRRRPSVSPGPGPGSYKAILLKDNKEGDKVFVFRRVVLRTPASGGRSSRSRSASRPRSSGSGPVPSQSKGSKGKSKGKRKAGLLATGGCIHRAARYSQAPSQTFQEAWSLEAQEESYQEFHPALTRTWNPWQVVSRSLQAGST